jgi:predicted nucleotidyltransferase
MLKIIDQTTVKALMGELRAGLQAIYGDRLKGVYLYGSYARGDADAESDLDVLMILDRIDHYSEEIERTSRLGAGLSLEYGVSISKVYLRERDWLERESPFLVNVREEAIAA